MTRLRPALLTCCALVALSATAQDHGQDRGQWRPMSTTARAITGEIALSEYKLILNFNAFTIAQIRALTPEEAAALFPDTAGKPSTANLYRLSIPADKKFLHKNTLCGSEETQWLVTDASGKQLEVAFFSGNQMPTLTAEAVANTTALCGTFSYTR